MRTGRVMLPDPPDIEVLIHHKAEGLTEIMIQAGEQAGNEYHT
jgi:hypothetical protein